MRDRTEEELHEEKRKALWMSIAVVVARSEECKLRVSPANWADETLARFDRTFPGPGVCYEQQKKESD